MLYGCVDSLVNASMYVVTKHLPKYGNAISTVPPNIKRRLLYLLCKRGLVNDVNITLLLYPKLREIDLSECDVTDASLLQISQVCIQLVKVDLNAVKGFRDQVTTAGVVALSKGCPLLQTVYLRRCCNVTDEALRALAENCPNLKQLNLGSCTKISDASLQALAAKCPGLECLNIAATSVTDDGILSLCAGAPRLALKELHINHCMQLSDRSVEGIMSMCPAINILLIHGCPKMTDRLRSTLEADNVKLKQVTWTVY
ncbi:unnamed protein product [Clavelina lepadiformis]|uniref:F-box/LRR-repeat protein 15-like leucin rich repeat domain-containing protein n=1 Tax=Clavelina lepadiformis TaxID=159417 RepID=A0ABP0FP80_CLALP